MSPIDIFLWGVYPYIVLTILVVGTIMRRVFFPRTWSTKSSQFLESKNEMVATPIFHLMLLFVLFGHLGMFIPKEVMDSIGVNEHMYHMAAFYMGGGAGVLLGIALILLIRRRFGIKRMKANTSRMDIVLYVLMTLTIVLGICATFCEGTGSEYYYAYYTKDGGRLKDDGDVAALQAETRTPVPTAGRRAPRGAQGSPVPAGGRGGFAKDPVAGRGRRA